MISNQFVGLVEMKWDLVEPRTMLEEANCILPRDILDEESQVPSRLLQIPSHSRGNPCQQDQQGFSFGITTGAEPLEGGGNSIDRRWNVNYEELTREKKV